MVDTFLFSMIFLLQIMKKISIFNYLEEIANVIGTATESAIRLLSEFKKEELILLNDKRIKILDSTGLEKIALGF